MRPPARQRIHHTRKVLFFGRARLHHACCTWPLPGPRRHQDFSKKPAWFECALAGRQRLALGRTARARPHRPAGRTRFLATPVAICSWRSNKKHVRVQPGPATKQPSNQLYRSIFLSSACACALVNTSCKPPSRCWETGRLRCGSGGRTGRILRETNPPGQGATRWQAHPLVSLCRRVTDACRQ